MREMRYCTEVDWKALENLGVDKGIILKFIFKKLSVRMWTRFFWLRIWPSVGLF
jgi:hypothetical protein